LLTAPTLPYYPSTMIGAAILALLLGSFFASSGLADGTEKAMAVVTAHRSASDLNFDTQPFKLTAHATFSNSKKPKTTIQYVYIHLDEKHWRSQVIADNGYERVRARSGEQLWTASNLPFTPAFIYDLRSGLPSPPEMMPPTLEGLKYKDRGSLRCTQQMGTEQCFDSTSLMQFEKRKMMDEDEILRFSDYREFGKKKVAYHAVWQRNDAPFLEITIDAIEPLTLNDPKWFVSPPAAEQVTWCDTPTPPKPVHTPDPSYPPTARNDRVQGPVQLFMALGADGKVRNVAVIRSLRKDLDDPAAAAASEWQFQPAMCGAIPMPWDLRVEINFHLY